MMFFQNITDILYKNSPFRITIFFPTDQRTFGRSTYEPIVVEGNNDNLRLRLDTYGRLKLGFHVMTDRETGKENKIFFSPLSFFSISDALSICNSWLTSKHFDYLFQKDKEKNIYAIGEPPPYLPAVYKSVDEYIRFYPAVVPDISGVKCEGIRIESHFGPFYQFTCTEFLNISSIIQNFIANQYAITIQLLNLGVNMIGLMKSSK
jgi:hypothetical protein